jgi:anhydro-N-acetylmuramic acid kinase
MRTLLELTIETVAQEVEKFSVSHMYVHGGGTANPLMMSRLKERLVGVDVNPMSVLGLDPRHKEAVTFAVIGFLSWHGVPASVISCTGAASAEILGSITFGNKPLKLPEPKANRKYSAVIAN